MSDQWEMELHLDEREEGEEDITERQLDFMQRLLKDVGANKPEFDIKRLGKWQASEIIDQLIAIRDEKQEELAELKSDTVSRIGDLQADLESAKNRFLLSGAVFAGGFVVLASSSEQEGALPILALTALSASVLFIVGYGLKCLYCKVRLDSAIRSATK
jgi:hypothetical protein